MTHQRDLTHVRTSDGPTAELDPSLAPGRAARTDDLIGPHGPLPSGLLMRKASGTVGPEAEQAVGAAASSSGEHLPDDLRARFESSLGTDLSAVRLHTGAESADAAAAVGAKAYALGNDIHFGAGHYDPRSHQGQELIAHEVAHTVQQRGGAATRQHKLEVSTPGDAHEQEADHAASAMVTGARFGFLGGAGAMIQREAEAPSEDKRRSAAIESINGISKTAAAIANTVSDVSSASSDMAKSAVSVLTANADAYRSAYTKFDTELDKADKNVARKKAIKDAIAETLVTTALMAILGPEGLMFKAEFEAMAESAKGAETFAAKVAAAAKEQVVEGTKKGLEAGVEKGSAAVMHGDAHEGSAGKGTADSKEGRLADALHSCNAIAQALPDIGKYGKAATTVMTAAMSSVSSPDAKAEKLEADLSNLRMACASLGSMGPLAQIAKTKLNQVTGPIIAMGQHTADQLEDQLWRQWIASLTDASAKEILGDKALHTYLEGRGIVAKKESAEDSVTNMQKEFLKQHGVTPPSEDPDVIQSLYKREVALAEVRARVIGKQGPLLENQSVQIDGKGWHCMKNDQAQVGDMMEVSYVYSNHPETATLEAWTDIDFKLMCRALNPRPTADNDD